MIAVAGIDMAAWDALSKAAGLPLCVFLGGSLASVPAYNSNGLWLQLPEVVATEAVELLEGGFKALKLRLGRAKHKDDLATIEAVRNAIGDDTELMVDYNQGLTLGEALERCHSIDDLGLAWIEEPLVYDNFEGHARLAAELRTPLQIGENFYGPRDLYAAVRIKASDFVMPDFMRIGGVTGWLRAASIAAVAGIPVSTHLYPEVAAHVMRVTETAHWLEWQDWVNPDHQGAFRSSRWASSIFPTALVLVSSGMRPPSASTCWTRASCLRAAFQALDSLEHIPAAKHIIAPAALTDWSGIADVVVSRPVGVIALIILHEVLHVAATRCSGSSVLRGRCSAPSGAR